MKRRILKDFEELLTVPEYLCCIAAVAPASPWNNHLSSHSVVDRNVILMSSSSLVPYGRRSRKHQNQGTSKAQEFPGIVAAAQVGSRSEHFEFIIPRHLPRGNMDFLFQPSHAKKASNWNC